MKLEQKIRDALGSLSAVHLDLVNESDMHNGPPNRESHFKLVIVSDVFIGLSRIARQQKINTLLSFAFKEGLHALTMKTLTMDEWNTQKIDFQSPDCAGKPK